MKLLISDLWQQDKKAFVCIMLMQILSSCMGGVGIVMLIPMMELFGISGETALLPEGLSSLWGQGTALFVLILCAYLGLIVFKALLGRALNIAQTRFLEGYSLSLRKRLYEAVSQASWQQLAAYPQAELIGLFTTQCTQLSSAVSCMIQLLTSLVSAGIQIAIACWMSVPITLVVFVCGIGMMAAFLPLRKKAQQYGNEMIAVSRDFYSELFHQLNSVKEIRTYGVEESHKERFDGFSRSFGEKQIAYAKVRTLPSVVSSIAAGVMISGVFALSLGFWKLDMARIVILILIFSRLWPLFSAWQNYIQMIQTNIPALEKLNQTIDWLKASAASAETQDTVSFDRTVQFSHVGFRYQPTEEMVLKDVSFSLEIGKITALVGRSGAGKSTTADLLMGFLTPEMGQILIDGCPLTSENGRAWRKSIGYIPQAPLILNDTVRQNLSRFHPDATEKEMIEALQQAVAWDFVSKLPQGLDTMLGDRGVRLSGGERQRIVLARVLLGQPRLIVLDEATSALDYESERAIRDVLDTLRKNAAILVIAHRLATVMIADEAVVLENGTITESGAFPELIRHSGGYLAGMMNME